VRRGAIAAVLLSVAAYGQIGVPTLGYLPEGPRIRVMQGIPGAGVVGPILGVGRNLAQITISPRQDYILASDAQTGQVLQIVPGAASASITAIPGASANPDQIVMSPSGSSAVLWFLATNRAEIISGLPASASIRGIDASVLGAAPGAMAISDDGAWLAASTLAATGIYIFAGDSSMSAIPLNDFANGLAFFHNQATLAITTSTGVSTVGLPGAALQTIYASARTLPPAGLAVSFDNQRIAIAEYSGTLTSVDLAGNVS
jgi:hypothetical protein